MSSGGGIHRIEEDKNMEYEYRIRKLTPLECWRIMGFTDADFAAAKVGSMDDGKKLLERFPIKAGSKQYCRRFASEAERLSKMSNTQLYKQAGNSICKPVLMALFSQLNISGINTWNSQSEDEKYELIERCKT